jgi:hypothetical protein
MNDLDFRKNVNFIFNYKGLLYNRNLLKFIKEETYFEERNFLIEKTSFLNKESSFNERLYVYYKNVLEIPKCQNPECFHKVSFNSFSYGYHIFCCKNCNRHYFKYRENKLKGIERNEKFKESIRKRMKGNSYALGVKRSDIFKQNISKNNKNKILSSETKDKISKSLKGRKRTIESIRKQRIYYMNKLINEYNICGKMFSPRINKNSFYWFDWFNNTFDCDGIYGNKGYEYYDSDLGYWFDYIDLNNYYIIEWDEERHYNKNVLKEKDRIRQQEIENKYKGFSFIRIRENYFLKLKDKEKFEYVLKQIRETM